MPKVRKKRRPAGYERIAGKLKELRLRARAVEMGEDGFDEVRREERMWALARVHHEQSRYLYELYKAREMSRELYDYCVRERLVDAALVAKWKKGPGFERLCCLSCVDEANFQHGTKCICRTPRSALSEESKDFECATCGCHGCC